MITTIISNVTGNGAKFVATNLAYLYKNKNPNKKTLLVDFDEFNPTLAMALYEKSINNSFNIIMQDLYNGIIEKDTLSKNVFASKNGLDILIGKQIHEINLTNEIKPKIFQLFFETMKDLYDEIFIVCTKNTNSNLNICTLNNSDNIVIVTKDNYSNSINIENTVNIINSYSNAKIFYINNYFKTPKNTDSILANLNLLGNISFKKNQIDNKNLLKKNINKINHNIIVFYKALKTLLPD